MLANRSSVAARRCIHTLPALPYAIDAISPIVSSETLTYHHGKHHATYVEKLNKMLESAHSDKQWMTVKDILRTTDVDSTLFQMAAQHFNHSFLWNSMVPMCAEESPTLDLKSQIDANFGSLLHLKSIFVEKSSKHFGSGWSWLVWDKDATSLRVITTHDAGNPIADALLVPLLCCDLWEHAYYLDYRNDRSEYLENFWKIVSWNFASRNFGGTQK